MAAADTYGKDITQVGPARNAVAVTPADDTTDLTNVSRAVSAGTDGNIAVIMSGGQSVTVPVKAGILYPIAVTRIKQTGTTATGIVAFW